MIIFGSPLIKFKARAAACHRLGLKTNSSRQFTFVHILNEDNQTYQLKSFRIGNCFNIFGNVLVNQNVDFLHFIVLIIVVIIYNNYNSSNSINVLKTDKPSKHVI